LILVSRGKFRGETAGCGFEVPLRYTVVTGRCGGPRNRIPTGSGGYTKSSFSRAYQSDPRFLTLQGLGARVMQGPGG